MNLDWDATYLQNHIIDYHQTVTFGRTNVRELNPVWSPIYKNESALALGFLVEAALQNNFAKRRTKELAILRILVVGMNGRNHRVEFPVLVCRF